MHPSISCTRQPERRDLSSTCHHWHYGVLLVAATCNEHGAKLVRDAVDAPNGPVRVSASASPPISAPIIITIIYHSAIRHVHVLVKNYPRDCQLRGPCSVPASHEINTSLTYLPDATAGTSASKRLRHEMRACSVSMLVPEYVPVPELSTCKVHHRSDCCSVIPGSKCSRVWTLPLSLTFSSIHSSSPFANNASTRPLHRISSSFLLPVRVQQGPSPISASHPG
ncbi:hypothetical protein V8C42DRAFT_262637 [Trichoderma barbatum]